MFKNKLKKVYKTYFAKKYTPDELFELKLKHNNLISDFIKTKNNYIVKNINLSLVVRNRQHSDYEVFKQIFNNQEYKIVLSLLNNNFSDNKESIIIDAGANVGYTSIYFLNQISNVKIIVIEPFTENMAILKENVLLNEFQNKVILYENALAETENKLFSIDNSFRDGKDWSINTIENAKGNVKGVTINEIIVNNKISVISILKIDIEGAERYIFDKKNNLDFLKITEIIAIEIHDEYDIRNKIYEILKDNNFVLLESGELTIGINKTLLKE